MSIFEIDDNISDTSYSIILYNNYSQSFKFSKDFNIMKYSYAHIENKNDVQINLNLLNKGKYTMNLFLNEELIKSGDKIENNTSILLKSNDIIKSCGNNFQLCKISFNIQSENQEDIESILKINIISFMNSTNQSDKSGDDKGGDGGGKGEDGSGKGEDGSGKGGDGSDKDGDGSGKGGDGSGNGSGNGSGKGGNNGDGENKEDLNKLILISSIIGGVIVVTLIILIVVICIYKKRQNDLLEKVNAISFSKNDKEEEDKEDDLLH